jgi:hypothetical protein
MTPQTRHRLADIIHAVRRVRRAQLLSIVCQWAQWEGLRVSRRDVRQLLRRPPSKRRRWHCLYCGIDTIAIGEYPYHLRDELWYAVVPSGRGMLCLDCLAVRLGRPLTNKDFNEAADGSPSQ